MIYFHFRYFQGRLSLKDPLGHVDYYPNGGSHQTGCNDIVCVGTSCLEMDLWDLFNGACSHTRAHEYYVESIYAAPVGGLFVSEPCDSFESYENGDCESNAADEKIPMGEAFNPDM